MRAGVVRGSLSEQWLQAAARHLLFLQPRPRREFAEPSEFPGLWKASRVHQKAATSMKVLQWFCHAGCVTQVREGKGAEGSTCGGNSTALTLRHSDN